MLIPLFYHIPYFFIFSKVEFLNLIMLISRLDKNKPQQKNAKLFHIISNYIFSIINKSDIINCILLHFNELMEKINEN